MFSDKINSNILTAVLQKHNVTTVVVCPGSRNAPLVNDFFCAGLTCIPVTDERSAGFYALGLALESWAHVAICVTSGSALLNLAPAVAEAYYRHVPLVVISADRPIEDIDRLQGQTIPQRGALGVFAPCYDLPIPTSTAMIALCERRANEALMDMYRHSYKPVHINVQLDEPLFRFTTPILPDVRYTWGYHSSISPDADYFRHLLSKSHRPLVVIGQQSNQELMILLDTFAVLYEPLGLSLGRGFVDDMLDMGIMPPDLVIYFGDTLVSKRAKKFLGADPDSRLVLVSADGLPHDVGGNLERVIFCDYSECAYALDDAVDSLTPEAIEYRKTWYDVMAKAHKKIDETHLSYGTELAVKLFEERAANKKCCIHYANSTVVRHALRHARQYCYVNRGVNGIEGSLSTAAGCSLGLSGLTFCVIGDLSFFYDCNALWPSVLGGNFRILLLNNSRGSIFDSIPGLPESPAFHGFIDGSHAASAAGICEAYNTGYRYAEDIQSLESGLDWLFTAEADRPILLEVKL